MRFVLLAFAALPLSEGLAFAAPDEREQCATAAETAQTARDEGRYRREREELLVCVRATCPGPIRKDCAQWLSEIERDAPTVVFGAKDARGSDVADASVTIDGEPLVDRLDGKPVLADAGAHTFTFRFPDGTTKETRVVLRASEKSRSIVVEASKEPSRLALPLALAGVGGVAVASFAFFGLQGRSDYDDLGACKPRCSDDAVSSVRTKLWISDISLGVAVVAVAAAAYVYFARPRAPKVTAQAALLTF